MQAVSLITKPADTPLSRALAEMRGFLYLPEPEMVYAVLGALAANMCEGEPVWLMLLGGPGCGKSEMLNMALGLPHVIEAADISSKGAFLSGTSAKDKDKNATGGLLKEVGAHGCLLINDYTTVLSMDPGRRGEVMAVIRELYLNRYSRPIGEGGGRRLCWEGKICFMAGCTNEIDRLHNVSSALGERWTYLRFDNSTSIRMQIAEDRHAANALGPGFAQALSALRNSGKSHWREDLRAITTRLFAEVKLGFGVVTPRRPFTDAESLRFIRMGAVSCRCRSGVPRDHYSKEINDIAEVEMEARMVAVLGQLYIGMELLGLEERKRWSVLGRVALDSMPRLKRFVLDMARLEKHEGARSEKDIAKLSGCSASVIHRTVEEMMVLGVLAKDRGGEKPQIGLSDWMRENLEKGWR
jgi:hypothetical protein